MTMLKILELAEETAERRWMRAVADYSFLSDNAGLFKPETLEIAADKEQDCRRDLREIQKLIAKEEAKEETEQG